MRRSRATLAVVAVFALACESNKALLQPGGPRMSLAPTDVDAAVQLTATASAKAGQEVTVTLTATNNGPAAGGVSSRLTVPVGFGGGSITAPGATCSVQVESTSAFTYACDHGTLTAGASQIVTVTGKTTKLGDAVFTSSVTSAGTDPNATNNSATATSVIVAANADLRMDGRVISTGPFLVGNQLSYGVVIHNDGPEAAPGFTISHDVPAGFTFLSASPGGSSLFCSVNFCSSNEGSCIWTVPPGGTTTHVECTAFQSLASGAATGISIFARPTASGNFTTVFTVAGVGLVDPQPGNDAGGNLITVVPTVALSVAATAPGNVIVGANYDYAYTVTNGGPDAATGVVVTIGPLPAQVELLSAPGCTGTVTLTCNLGNLAAGATQSGTISLHSLTTGNAAVVANVASGQAELSSADNSVTRTTSITAVVLPGGVDVSVELSAPATVKAGELATITMTVKNAGPEAATGLVTRLVTPPQFGGGSINGVGCTVRVESNGAFAYECEPGILDNGGTQTVTLTGSTKILGDAVFTVSMTTTSADREPANNTARATIDVQPASADLRTLARMNTTSPITVGSVVSYGFQVINNGPELAPGFVVMHDLPAGLSIVAALPGGSSLFCGGDFCVSNEMSCRWFVPTGAAQTRVECTALVPLASGRLTGGTIQVNPTVAGEYTPTFSVSGVGTTDPDPGNNTDATTFTVTGATITCPANVSVPNDAGQPGATLNPGFPVIGGTQPFAVNGQRSDGRALGSQFPLGTTRIAWTVTDGTGSAASCQQLVVVTDNVAPTIAATTGTVLPASGWFGAPVSVAMHAQDNAGAGAVSEIIYTVGAGAAVHVAGADASLSVSAEGTTEIRFHAVDRSGNAGADETLTLQVDLTSPTVSCDASDGMWHGVDVTVMCHGRDAVSSLAQPADAFFGLSTSAAPGTESANVSTGTHSVCDLAGHCVTAGPVAGNKIDLAPPSLTVTSPADGASYPLNGTATVGFSCSDGGSGIVSCFSNQSQPGAPVDLTTVGTHTFIASALDDVGNRTDVTTHYQVTAPVGDGLCLGEPARRPLSPFAASGVTVVPGNTVPVKFRVCDSAGHSVSTPNLVTSFRRLDGGRISSTSSFNAFRWDPSGQLWIYNLSMKDLIPGRPYDYEILLADGSRIRFQLQAR